MRTKRYVEGGSIFTNPMPTAANRPQPNVNMPQQGQPGQQPAAQPADPFKGAYTSGIAPQQPTLSVGEPSSSVPPPASGPTFRKGGYVKAADGIAQRGKTKGRMA